MDLRQLRYFLQISETGSFSKAAEILNVAQPSLSQHVLNLEQELGVPLLTRHPRGVFPTDFGQLLCDHARIILRDVERSQQAVRNAIHQPAGEISLGLPTSACGGLAVQLITEALRLHPQISIHLVEAMTGSLEEWVQSGRLDVALLYDRKSFEDIESSDFMTEELHLIVPRGHALASERAVLFNDAISHPLVLPAAPHVIRGLIERHALRADAALNVAVNCDSLAAIVQLVRSGYGTIYPSFPMAEEIARGDLVAVPIVNPTPKWQISIVLSKRTSNRRAAVVIAQLVNDVARRLVEVGKWDAQLRRLTRDRQIFPSS